MTGEYPDYATYGALYLRYYGGRDVSELLDLLEPVRETHVLDLCGGEGRLTLAAVARGAREVTLVDAAASMIPESASRNLRVRVWVADVREMLSMAQWLGDHFDRIACRQAVNYWLDMNTAQLVADVLPQGGIFAFNTFNQKPPEKPRVLEYVLGEHSFTEVSWLVGDTVHHVQIREGMAPHYTSFAWLPPELLRTMLEPHFTISEVRREKTSLYKCVKK